MRKRYIVGALSKGSRPSLRYTPGTDGFPRRLYPTMLHLFRSRWFAAVTIGLLAGSFAIAQNNAPAKSDSKIIPTPDAPADSTTDGTVTVGGQAIDYRAVAGTLTVGATDTQDAMLGLDGKPARRRREGTGSGQAGRSARDRPHLLHGVFQEGRPRGRTSGDVPL